MADISTHVDPIVGAIWEVYEARNKTEKPRTYLGASIIGRECERALWYGFRWASREQLDGRALRLFQTGHMAEPRLVADLRAINVQVYDVDPATGKQFGFQSLGGHMRGHMDGCAQFVPGGGQKWHVVEFKTHSAKSFGELKKHGVQKAKPEHWAQMNWYMGKSGMTRALYMAVNKDNDDLYTERLEFDQLEFTKTEAKAERIIFAAEPPARISEDPKFYLCNWCPHSAVCHGKRVPPPSCRTCVHATPERQGDGRWSCAKVNNDPNLSSIPVEIQRTGCNEHLPLPYLVTYAMPVDAGADWIEFERIDNQRRFVVRTRISEVNTSLPSYTTDEVSAAADHNVITNPEVEDLRKTFNGRITG